MFGFRQRVVHDFRKAVVRKEICDLIIHFFTVGFAWMRQTHLRSAVIRNAVIAVDAQNFFNHIHFARNINFIGRHLQRQIRELAFNADFKRLQNVQHRSFRNIMSHQTVHFFARKRKDFRFDFIRINIYNFRWDGSACNFFNQQCCAFQRIKRNVRVCAAFVAKRRIGFQSVQFRGFADTHRIEVGAFQKDGCRLFRNARFLAAKYACDAHAFVGIANHQFAAIEFAVYTIQGFENSVFRKFFYNHFLSENLCRIKRMQGLSVFHQNEIRNIHYIVDGSQTNGFQAIFQPFRRFFNLNAGHGKSRISRAIRRIFNDHFNRKFGVIHLKSIQIRIGQTFVTQCFGVNRRNHISCYANVRCRITAIGRQSDFKHHIAFDFEICCSRSPYRSRRFEHHNSIVAMTQAQFIFGTNHAFGNLSANFGFFDFKGFITFVNYSSDSGYRHFLSGGNIRRTTNNMQQFRRANIHRSNAQFICVRMFFARFHFTNNHAFQASTNRFDMFETFHFKSAVGQDNRQFFGGLRDVGVGF